MSPQRFIKKAMFDFCADEECTVSQDSHLLVSEDLTLLERGNAVAISYTWGEFNRRDILIGHLRNGLRLTLSLGEEWNPNDLVARLRSISVESKGCWIDQICIPQNDETVRATLADIPDIYKTLDVIVLLPSAPCKCFDDLADLAHKGADTLESVRDNSSADEYRRADGQRSSEWHSTQLRCLNSVPCTSWFSRLWTRQELQYASNVRVVYSTDKRSSCFSVDMDSPQSSTLLQDDRDVHLLQQYLALTFKTSSQSTGSRFSAFKALVDKKKTVLHGGIQAIGGYSRSKSHISSISDLCRFLSGTRIENAQPSNIKDNDEAKVRTFLEKLVGLGADRRVATQERDYAVAVWVDCPRYSLPVEYKSMSLVALLDDAMDQLETNFGVSPLSYAPAGAFEKTLKGSGLWKPSAYLHRSQVEYIGRIYCVFPTNSVVVTDNKGFRLSCFFKEATALSQVAKPFEQALESKTTAAVFDVMANIAIKWETDAVLELNLVQAAYTWRQGVNDGINDAEDDFRQSLCECVRSGEVHKKWLNQDIDHYSVIYRLVTDILGLDYHACQAADLVLMISTQASCLGLLRAASVETAQSNITVAMSVQTSGCLAYEAEPVAQTTTAESSIPRFRVCGIWVPTKALGVLNINYYKDPEGTDGRVV